MYLIIVITLITIISCLLLTAIVVLRQWNSPTHIQAAFHVTEWQDSYTEHPTRAWAVVSCVNIPERWRALVQGVSPLGAQPGPHQRQKQAVPHISAHNSTQRANTPIWFIDIRLVQELYLPPVAIEKNTKLEQGRRFKHKSTRRHFMEW